MRKLFFTLVSMIMSVVTATATDYTLQFEDCDGNATISYYDSSSSSQKSIDVVNGESFTVNENVYTLYLNAVSGYMIESIEINANDGGYAEIPVSNASGTNYIYRNGSSVYDSTVGSYVYVGAWSSEGTNKLRIKTCSLAEARKESFTVEADNYDNFYLRRYDGTMVTLSAEDKTVAFNTSLDQRFYVGATGSNDLISVLVDGVSQSISSNQCNFSPSGLDGKTVTVTTLWPDEEYTLSFSGTDDGDCFSSITVDGVETAFADLKSSYKAGTTIVLVANSAYDFSTFSCNTDSSLNAYYSTWTIKIKANTVITVAASKAEVYTATFTVNGPDNKVSVYSNYTTTYLPGNGETTTLSFKKSGSPYLYINNNDANNYNITEILYNGVAQSSISQSSSGANYFYLSGDATFEITVAEKVLDGKITFQFDDYTQATLTDTNWNTITVDSNEFVYAIEKTATASFKLYAKDSSNSNFKVKLNGTECSSSYGTYYVYNAKDGDIITVRTQPSDVKYTLSVTNNSEIEFSDLFNYVTAASETITSFDQFAEEYPEDTQIDFSFKDALIIDSFVVNGTAVNPLYNKLYRVTLTENTTIEINAHAKAQWTFYVNVTAPDYVTLRDASNNYSAVSLVEGENTLTTVEGNVFIVSWNYNDGSTMNSVILDDQDLTPTNVYNTSVQITLTADGQHLYINNTAPIVKNDVLTVTFTGTAYSGNVSVTDKNGNDFTTVRLYGTDVAATDYNFSLSEEAPLTFTFYGFTPKEVKCNGEVIKASVYTPEVAEGETGNTTSQVSYTLNNLVEGNNTLDFDITEEATGVRSVSIDNAGNGDVYNLQGVRVLKAADADQLRQLPAGVYIMNGQKIIKR